MQRGFTLIELLVTVAIVITMTALAAALSLGALPFAMRSAVDEFDTQIDYARSLAATSGNGATIVFEPRRDAQGAVLPGFRARVYAGRPNSAGALKVAPIPAIDSSGDISEASLGSPPFSIFFDSAGHASGMSGAVTTGSLLASDPGCPGGESQMTFIFRDPRATDRRLLSCLQSVAGAPSAPAAQGP